MATAIPASTLTSKSPARLAEMRYLLATTSPADYPSERTCCHLSDDVREKGDFCKKAGHTCLQMLGENATLYGRVGMHLFTHNDTTIRAAALSMTWSISTLT